MRERTRTPQTTAEEADMRRLAQSLGYRLEKHRQRSGRWYIVEAGAPLSIVAQNLTLAEAGETLLIAGPAGVAT
jgi:hypothetical protein